ncbi:MAG TPA: PEP-CTERM sorting domain-containing protein, partial [Phycisphaerae bacterium]|nr:PEP-CTERM sorting domain-containing protein [Phycisphaerae bacterium]
NVTLLGSYTPLKGDTWRLLNYPAGTLTDNGLALGSMPSLGQPDWFWQVGAGTAGEVNLTVLPEPATLALLGLGALSLLARRRR